MFYPVDKIDPRSNRHNSNPLPVIGLIAVFMGLGFRGGELACAQAYKSIEPKMTAREASALAPILRKGFRATEGFLDDADRQKFDSNYTDYLFPLMTRQDPKGLAELDKKRDTFLREIRNSRSPVAVQHLAQLTFDWWKPIVADSYHPAVRNMGVLLISNMDERLEDIRSGTPPIPLAAATDFLLELVATDPDQVPIYLKLTALRGLQRHAQCKESFTPERAAKLQAAAVDLANQPKPAHCSDAGYAWFQSVVTEVLAELGQLGDNQAVHTTILKLIEAGDRSLDHRCRAARALSQLKPLYTEGCGVDGTATTKVLATLAKDITAQEAEDGKKFSDGQLIFGGGVSSYSEEANKYPRRRTLYRLECVQSALDAVAGIVQDPMKENFSTLQKTLQDLANLADQEDGIDMELARALRESAPVVDDLVRQMIPEAGPAKDDSLDLDL